MVRHIGRSMNRWIHFVIVNYKTYLKVVSAGFKNRNLCKRLYVPREGGVKERNHPVMYGVHLIQIENYHFTIKKKPPPRPIDRRFYRRPLNIILE